MPDPEKSTAASVCHPGKFRLLPGSLVELIKVQVQIEHPAYALGNLQTITCAELPACGCAHTHRVCLLDVVLNDQPGCQLIHVPEIKAPLIGLERCKLDPAVGLNNR